MLRLYIMRHAKSSWAIPGARDFDRELNDRGYADLKKISSIIENEAYLPEKIICSSATRTRQTLDAIQHSFKDQPEIVYTERLYSSGLDEYVEIVNSNENIQSLMIIGHNPMCGSLATSLPGSGEQNELEKIAYKYPTSAFSIIDFEVDRWSEISKGSGILQKSIFPSQI